MLVLVLLLVMLCIDAGVAAATAVLLLLLLLLFLLAHVLAVTLALANASKCTKTEECEGHINKRNSYFHVQNWPRFDSSSLVSSSISVSFAKNCAFCR